MKKILSVITMILFFLSHFFIAVHAEELAQIWIPIKADAGAIIRIQSSEHAPLPEKTRITADAEGNAQFTITYEEPGTYHYNICRMDTNAFDHYEAVVTVLESENGTCQASLTVIQHGTKASSVSFITYVPDPPQEPITDTGDAFHLQAMISMLAVSIVICILAAGRLKHGSKE